MIVNDPWFAPVALGIAGLNALYIAIICIASEFIAPIERFTLRERVPGLIMGLTGSVLSAAVFLPAQLLWQEIGVAPYQIPLWTWLEPLGTLGFILQIAIILLLADFLRYWRHRAEHRWFWPIHAVHHAPTKLHAANSLGHPLQTIPEILMVSLPLSLIAFDGPETPAIVMFVSSFLTTHIHSPTEIHFGKLRKVMVDNRFHRIHHSIERRHYDKNFGICFSLWDWAFGTAHWPAKEEWPSVGVEGLAPPTGVRSFLLMPLRIVRGTAGEPDAAPASIDDAGIRTAG